jgi:P4 family phage/plasmid primase-like protien
MSNNDQPFDYEGVKFNFTDPSDITEPNNPAKEAWKAKVKAECKEIESHVFYYLDQFRYCSTKDFNTVNDDGESVSWKIGQIGEYIAGTFDFKTDIKTGILYFYNGKTWIANAEPYLQYITNKVLREETKVGHYKNIEFIVKARTYQELKFSQKLALENGLLDVETLEFKEYSEDTKNEMPFHYIPVKYDIKAECPQWDVFVKDIMTAEDIATLQEWSGYLLLPDYRFHKLMWMTGTGRNGKGVWQRTMETMLGYSNVSHVGLEEFDGNHRFGIVQLYGKLFNPCSEPGTTKILQTNLLKYATGQDMIEGELKAANQRLAFTNTAKLTVLANKFPRVNDQTTAFKERRLFLNYPKEFIGSNVIANIERNWLQGAKEEKSGILNWMLQGLQRLLNQGYFTTSKTQQETELAFLRASDSISAFINETATYNKNVFSTRDDAKNAYNAYCDFYGLDIENDKKLVCKIRDLPHVKDTSKRVVGEKTRVWEGITFKVLSEEIEEKEPCDAKQATLTAKVEHMEHLEHVITPSYTESKISYNIEERETCVPSVPTVPTSEAESNNSNITEKGIIEFERLAPHDKHDCDGYGCHFEAQFKTNSGSFYCRTCLARIGKDCNANGFMLVEVNQKEPENLDGERF